MTKWPQGSNNLKYEGDNMGQNVLCENGYVQVCRPQYSIIMLAVQCVAYQVTHMQVNSRSICLTQKFLHSLLLYLLLLKRFKKKYHPK